jgi:hypothetical protein
MAEDATPVIGDDAPESGMSTSSVEMTAATEDILVMTLSDALNEITRLRSENAELEKGLREAVAYVEQLARMPLGRRTSAAPVISDFRRAFSGVYSDAWLKYIEEKDKEL